MRRLFRRKGEITVFLALILSTVLGLLCVIFESARIQFIKLEKEIGMDAALRSCFGEYHKELYEKYDLLYIDTAYRVAQANIENTQRHLRTYMEENMDSGHSKAAADLLGTTVTNTTIEEYLLGSDYGGLPTYSQAVEYLKKYGDISHIPQIENIRNQLPYFDSEGVLGNWDEALSRVHSFNVFFINPAEEIRGMAAQGAKQTVTARSFRQSGLPYRDVPSVRQLKKGNYSLPSVNENESVFTEYLLQKCGSYPNSYSDSVLSCELEYLIYGKSKDMDNATAVADRLIRIFAKENLEYLSADASRQSEMEDLAERIVPYPVFDPLCPEAWFDRELLKEAVVDSLECAWAQTEAILKTDRLLGGGRVSANEPSAEWILPLDVMTEYRTMMYQSGGSGFGYQEYLSVFLRGIEREILTKRFLDIVEINMRNLGSPGFAADGCIEYMKARIDTNSTFGHDYYIVRSYAYENRYRNSDIA